jgi:predicted glycogen debranching enzyme
LENTWTFSRRSKVNSQKEEKIMTDFILKNSEITHDKEWLVTNGIGGFACGTLKGIPTRKYHSYLNAVLPTPFGRTIMLNYISEEIINGENIFPLTEVQFYEKERPNLEWLVEFRLQDGIPFWRYEKQGIIIEKSLLCIHKQNTLCLFYELLSPQDNVTLKWRPYFHFRMLENAVNLSQDDENYYVKKIGNKYEIECPHFPLLRILDESNASFVNSFHELENVFYEIESLRGYESIGSLKSPGSFSFLLKSGCKTALVISTEEWPNIEALNSTMALDFEKFRKKNLLKAAGIKEKKSIKSKLILAADQFLITPISRFQDMVKLQSGGEELRSIIAGFPWFTDWGRDTMISLEGLTLCTGRFKDAHAILYTFSHYVNKGLIPNMFPDGSNKGIYNTADASLWFFHAIDRYMEITNDFEILDALLPCLTEIINSHINGTFFGIHVDPEDGLLIQGADNYALTWMDAKLKDWIVTPRKGKAVEINALWYNALNLFEKWSDQSFPITKKCYKSFNEKFWYQEGKYLYDVIEGENIEKDPSIRPNQLFAISLKYPILNKGRWKEVLEVTKQELLTPFGLRTLAPSDPNYQQYYQGNLSARDGAYHQGTVWPWLIGPFVDAWLKVYPEQDKESLKFLSKILDQVNEGCIGTIGEINDAKDPYHARGCFAQAWSVAEVLRILCKIT